MSITGIILLMSQDLLHINYDPAASLLMPHSCATIGEGVKIGKGAIGKSLSHQGVASRLQ
jgi:hypothetical protein